MYPRWRWVCTCGRWSMAQSKADGQLRLRLHHNASGHAGGDVEKMKAA